jgi:hypothetical protein
MDYLNIAQGWFAENEKETAVFINKSGTAGREREVSGEVVKIYKSDISAPQPPEGGADSASLTDATLTIETIDEPVPEGEGDAGPVRDDTNQGAEPDTETKVVTDEPAPRATADLATEKWLQDNGVETPAPAKATKKKSK